MPINRENYWFAELNPDILSFVISSLICKYIPHAQSVGLKKARLPTSGQFKSAQAGFVPVAASLGVFTNQ